MGRLDYTVEEIIDIAVHAAFELERDVASVAFELTFSEFKKIILQPCYFCRGKGTTPLTTQHKRTRLDRLDWYKGFSLSNTLSCCTHCYDARRKVPYRLIWPAIKVFRKLGKINAENKARKTKKTKKS